MSNLMIVGPVDEATGAAEPLWCHAVWVTPDGRAHGCDYTRRSYDGLFDPEDPNEIASLGDLRVVFLVYAPETTEQLSPRYEFLARAGLNISWVVVLPIEHDFEERELKGLPPLPEGFVERNAVLRRVVELTTVSGPRVHPSEWGGDVPYFFTESETGVPEIRFLSNNMVVVKAAVEA